MWKLIPHWVSSTPASLLTSQGTAVYPEVQPSTDQSISKMRRIIRVIVMSLINSFEIIMRLG